MSTRAWRMRQGEIAVVVDFGERRFRDYVRELGAPYARYYGSGGSEVSRQWIVRRRANARLFVPLARLLRGKADGEVCEVRRAGGGRRAMVAA